MLSFLRSGIGEPDPSSFGVRNIIVSDFEDEDSADDASEGDTSTDSTLGSTSSEGSEDFIGVRVRL
jgi:hypothetical protein